MLLPAAIGTLLATVLCRIITSHRPANRGRNLIIFFATVAALGWVLGAVGILISDGGFSPDVSTVLMMMMLTAMVVMGLLASPLLTFSLMRLAGYRMLHPSRQLRTLTLNVERKSCRLSGAVDAGNHRVCFDDERLAVAHGVAMFHADFADFDDLRGQRQQIVEFGGGVITYVHLGNHQHQPLILQSAITDAGGSQQLHPAPLEVVQVVGMMHSALPVRFVVGDADLDRVGGSKVRGSAVHGVVSLRGSSERGTDRAFPPNLIAAAGE